MKIIEYGRGKGKSYNLVKEAIEQKENGFNPVIICDQYKAYLEHLLTNVFKKPKNYIDIKTANELRNSNYFIGRRNVKANIDDADDILKKYFHLNFDTDIEIITCNKKESE